MKKYKIITDGYKNKKIITPEGYEMTNVISCDIHLDGKNAPTAVIEVLDIDTEVEILENNVKIRKIVPYLYYDHIILMKEDNAKIASIYSFCKGLSGAIKALDELEKEAVNGLKYLSLTHVDRTNFDTLEIYDNNLNHITYQIIQIKNKPSLIDE